MDGFGNIPRAENGDMGSPAEFARLAGGLGIDNDTTVIVYDTPSQRMGMVAWAFLYYGHADVRILDGGIAKWLAEGRALDTQLTRVAAGHVLRKRDRHRRRGSFHAARRERRCRRTAHRNRQPP